jgi:hypothetical protein
MYEPLHKMSINHNPHNNSHCLLLKVAWLKLRFYICMCLMYKILSLFCWGELCFADSSLWKITPGSTPISLDQEEEASVGTRSQTLDNWGVETHCLVWRIQVPVESCLLQKAAWVHGSILPGVNRTGWLPRWNGVGNVFLAHVRFLDINWATFPSTK